MSTRNEDLKKNKPNIRAQPIGDRNATSIEIGTMMEVNSGKFTTDTTKKDNVSIPKEKDGEQSALNGNSPSSIDVKNTNGGTMTKNNEGKKNVSKDSLNGGSLMIPGTPGRKPVVSILKKSRMVQNDDNIVRQDNNGNSIIRGGKKHKIQFKEKIHEVKIVENWKEYNTENYDPNSKCCKCTIF
jgi:hypothetical protein